MKHRHAFHGFLLAAGACWAAGCAPLTPEEQARIDMPLHMQILTKDPARAPGGAPAGITGTDPVILNALFELLKESDKMSPDISKIAGTSFEELLKVGSPAGYTLRNRYLHPGVPLAEALATKPDPAMRDRLVELARWERSAEVRTTALIALARIGNVEDIRIFQEASAHIDAAVRFGALEALQVWGHPDKAKPILKAASENDTQPLLRVYAAAGMARLEDEEGLSKLRTYLTDGDWVVRAMAARYLGEFGEAADYDRLLTRISREEGHDFVLAECCIAALKLFPKVEP